MSDVDPTELTGAGRRVSAETFPPELPEGHSSPGPPGPKKVEREGLPAGYRMRADAHYVDQLATRRGQATPGGEDARADYRDRRDSRDRRMDHVIAQLTEDVSTIASAVAIVGGETSATARRVNLDLIRSQAWRAAWLLKASAILGGTYEVQPRQRPLGFVLGQVRNGFAAEGRLGGFTVNVHVADWNAVALVDESALIAGVSGAVVATLGLLGQAEGAALRISAQSGAGGLQSIEIAQDDLALPASASSRFFDASWTARPGGWLGELGAHVAKTVVEQHGGHATFHAGDRVGSVLKLDFSRER